MPNSKENREFRKKVETSPEILRQDLSRLNIHWIVKEIKKTKAHIKAIEEGKKAWDLVKHHEISTWEIHLKVVWKIHDEVDKIIRWH